MSTPGFDPNDYWNKRAPGYRHEERLHSAFYADQEQILEGIVRELDPGTILEVGCNYGRITRVLRKACPQSWIYAFDLCQAAYAGSSVPGVMLFTHDLCSDDPLPSADLCVAIEVFLHHPSDTITRFIGRALRSCKQLIHEVDLSVKASCGLAEHCFFHDYGKMYSDMRLKARLAGTLDHAFYIVSADAP